MNTPLIGREEEQAILKNLLNSNRSEFIAIYGRRRIGKTFLIRSFFKNKKDAIFLNATGSKDSPLNEQITHFTQHIGDAFFSGITPKSGKNWDETFAILSDAINAADPNKKLILFLDELPWMATKNSRLLQNIDYYWNQYWSSNNNIKLIVCGSSASWIINKIINNKGGLHNRVTQKIQLNPFKLGETKAFLHASGIKLNNDQVTQLYMITGGIPYYLARINKGQSAAQAIENLAFKQNSLLLKEFDNLFPSLFDNPEPYVELLRIISQHRYGLSQQDIAKKSKLLSKGGGISRKLKELKEAGFILAFKPYQHKKKGVYYRIIDEYTLFYLHWIEPIRDSLQEESLEKGYWQGIQCTPAWQSWSGYAFEAICYKHLSQIRKKFEIPPTAIATSWRYVPRKDTSNQGAQIDLLFDRLDNTITICEIKYSSKPFVISKQYAENLSNKGKVFSKQARNKKQQFMTMVASHGIKDNPYSDALITGVATLSDLFKII